MKKIEVEKDEELKKCQAQACRSCATCGSINFEEQRKPVPERTEHAQLYAAELLSYYFYLPALTRLAK